MKQSIFTILSNEALTDVVYRMVLSGDTSAITNCGQFVDLRLPEKYLRRPISVCDYGSGKKEYYVLQPVFDARSSLSVPVDNPVLSSHSREVLSNNSVI